MTPTMETHKKASVEELAEAHERQYALINPRSSFIAGYNEAAKTLYSEEEIIEMLRQLKSDCVNESYDISDALHIQSIDPTEYLKKKLLTKRKDLNHE